MKAFLVFALLIASTFALSEKEYQNAFTNWMIQNNKSYASSEFFQRYNIFKNNMDIIEKINSKNEGFTVAMNKFGDLNNVEFAAMYNGLRVPEGYVHVQSYTPSLGALPATKDWRQEGAVTAVKNQGQCGSCWSFSTTGSVEGCHKIGASKLVALSEKNLMDCSWSQGNEGCNGGLMTQAMDYIVKNKGIDTEASYPYKPEDSHQCKYSASNKGSGLGSYSNVKSGSESDLQNSVNSGPTSVAIDASQSSFQFYHSGVYYDASCSSSQLDHGVLAVGWGSDSGKDYWIVKNSWGADWGNAGYIWMSRNRKNNCGIATMATLPKSCN